MKTLALAPIPNNSSCFMLSDFQLYLLNCLCRHHGENSTAPMRRRSGTEAMVVIRQKMEADQQLRREEMGAKRVEEERRKAEERERDRRFEALQQQQIQQQQQMVQQQQQLQQQILQQQQQFQQQNLQTQAMMMAIFKSVEKKD